MGEMRDERLPRTARWCGTFSVSSYGDLAPMLMEMIGGGDWNGRTRLYTTDAWTIQRPPRLQIHADKLVYKMIN